MKRYKAEGPSQQYRWQAHIYGTGMALQGHDVAHVSIVFIPRSGLTSGIHVWTEPYDPQVTAQALQRYEAIQLVATKLGPANVPTGAPGAVNCNWCNWYDPASSDLSVACTGPSDPPPVTGNVTEPTAQPFQGAQA